MEEEKNLSNTQKKINNMLSSIHSWFGKKKDILRIRVTNGKQTFWVSNKKKMKFWKGLAYHQGTILFKLKDNTSLPTVRILKVIYKE